MNPIFKLPKITTLLLVIFLSSTGISCKDQKGQKNKLEDENSFAGSSKRDDICQLLTEDDLRTVFELTDEVKLTQDESHEAICAYDWKSLEDSSVFYSVSLNFAGGGKRSTNQLDKAWKSQNKGVYAKRNMQPVSGVGDKASWSDLGGGQLRVAEDGYIFYVSFFVMVMSGENKPLDTQGMIDKASVLAKEVIKNM